MSASRRRRSALTDLAAAARDLAWPVGRLGYGRSTPEDFVSEKQDIEHALRLLARELELTHPAPGRNGAAGAAEASPRSLNSEHERKSLWL